MPDGRPSPVELRRQHRNTAGGFCDISVTPGSLQYPLTVLTQNANVASFFVRLADLSGDIAYRKTAQWALRRFPTPIALTKRSLPALDTSSVACWLFPL